MAYVEKATYSNNSKYMLSIVWCGNEISGGTNYKSTNEEYAQYLLNNGYISVNDSGTITYCKNLTNADIVLKLSTKPGDETFTRNIATDCEESRESVYYVIRRNAPDRLYCEYSPSKYSITLFKEHEGIWNKELSINNENEQKGQYGNFSVFNDPNLENSSYAMTNTFTFNSSENYNAAFALINDNEVGDNRFQDCSNLKSVSFPSTMKIISESAFENCGSLSGYSPSLFITEIKNNAFKDCGSLKEAKIGKSLSVLGESAFESCSNLEYISFEYVENDKELNRTLKTIPNYCFYGCSSLKGTKYLLRNLNCSSINTGSTYNDKIVIPNGIETIGENAFHACSSIKNVELPNSIDTIGEYAFYDCEDLETINIDNTNITVINDYTFSECNSLESITIPTDVTSIGNYSFQDCSSLISVTIPDSVTSIGNNAFEYCVSLTNVIIPNRVTNIYDSTFKNCTGITSVTIGSGVTSIGNNAFQYCTSLTSIDIPNSVTILDYESFDSCSSLTSCTIGNGVENINTYAFYGCSNLISVTCYATTPPTLGSRVFANDDNLEHIYVPSESVDTYKAASGWSDYSGYIEAIP